jgi:hypothetical protein
MALVPGISQYQFNYVIPLRDGKADLLASTPAPVKMMMVVVPEGAAASGEGLEGPKTANMGHGNSTYFKASNLPANKPVKLSIDVRSAKKVGQSTTPATNNPFDAATAAKAIGGVGAILVVLLGAAFMAMKSPRQVRAQKQHA